MTGQGGEPEELTANGVHGRTGQYLLEPVPLETAARALADDQEAPDQQQLVDRRVEDQAAAVAGIDPDVTPSDLAQAGWGILFNGDPDRADDVAAIRRQLEPLIEHRAAQATSVDSELFQEYSGTGGYRAGRSALSWMAFHGTGPGTAYPADMPVHLLIVGSPEEIDFEFQYGLDVQRSVGRIYFDELEDYGRYARSVVAAETRGAAPARRVSLFGPRNPRDKATALSSSRLIAGLTERLAGHPGWEADAFVEDAATKDQLTTLVAGPDPPALLFTASHGVGFDVGDPLQRTDQGALICQDWNGDPGTMGPEMYFGASDVDSGVDLAGRMAFIFACYGGGTPRTDDFAHRISPTTERTIAEEAFVAALPQRLLAGGMLAVAAHVDRAWSFSFQWGRARTQIRSFEATMRMLMNGDPIGIAFEHMNDRAAELGLYKAELLASSLADRSVLASGLGLWTAANDARNYIVYGDPAARLPVN